MTSDTKSSEAEESKKEGNECMKKESYVEAMLHYTRAIKLDTKNHTLYSNRSYAFLKMQSHYHALEDAKQAINLQPKWPKGYYRKGEAEFAAEHFSDAVKSYRQGLILDSEDKGLQDAVNKANREMKKQTKYESRCVYYGAGLGLLFAVMIIIGNEFMAEKSVLHGYVLKTLIAFLFSLLGYAMALGYRYFIRVQRESLLQEPPDLFPEMESGEDTSQNDETTDKKSETKKKGGATAARQRYRKGKS